MSQLFRNPELIRNARISLRPNRMLLIAGICGVLSVVTGVALAHTNPAARRISYWYEPWYVKLLVAVVVAQSLIFVLCGSLQALFSVEREKDKNSFDFQRLTRMSDWELTVGKFAGAALLPLFIVLCLVPAGLLGSIYWGHPGAYLVALCIVVFGSMPIYALALLLSVWVDRRSAMVAIGLLAVAILFMAATNGFVNSSLELGTIGPFYSISFVENTFRHAVWAPANWIPSDPGDPVRYTDRFVGTDVNHLVVIAVITISLTAWLLIAAKRNIKRDPLMYRALSPWQAVGFATYLNVLFLGFFRWASDSFSSSLGEVAAFESAVFLLLGFILLRNRERTRRMIRDSSAAPKFWEATWPAGYVILAGLIVEFVSTNLMWKNYGENSDWSFGVAVYSAAFFIVWAARDIQFLQWRAAVRARRSLLNAFICLAAFYVATSILLLAFGLFGEGSAGFISFLVPTGVFAITRGSWHGHQFVWIAGLVVQLATAMLFAILHWREIKSMAASEIRGSV